MTAPTQLQTAHFATLATTFINDRFADDAMQTRLAKSVMVIVGSLVIALAAQVAIPMYPVPVTGQTLAILLIGMTYGTRLAGITVALYLFEGAMGLPVFANGAAGALYMFGPTGGYLAGFLIAAITIGFLAERGMGRTILSTIGAMLVGTAIIYAFGVSWLSMMIGLENAVIHGVLPFLYGDVLKAVVAAGIMPFAWKAIKKFGTGSGDHA
ncbi:biotin transporter BioY [Alphaproteobacteria bacterium]|nr:biotin transporter BioY [Alphaproteobacteria bacterium]